MSTTIGGALAAARDQYGVPLAELATGRPLLLVFLRHLGCTFCREALDDVARLRATIERTGTRIAFVHMTADDAVRPLIEKARLAEVSRVSDPEKHLYRAFGLVQGSAMQLFGPMTMFRGLPALLAHGIGLPAGDPLQMPGVFLVQDGAILKAFRHESIADRPDYAELSCPVPPAR